MVFVSTPKLREHPNSHSQLYGDRSFNFSGLGGRVEFGKLTSFLHFDFPLPNSSEAHDIQPNIIQSAPKPYPRRARTNTHNYSENFKLHLPFKFQSLFINVDSSLYHPSMVQVYHLLFLLYEHSNFYLKNSDLLAETRNDEVSTARNSDGDSSGESSRRHIRVLLRPRSHRRRGCKIVMYHLECGITVGRKAQD